MGNGGKNNHFAIALASISLIALMSAPALAAPVQSPILPGAASPAVGLMLAQNNTGNQAQTEAERQRAERQRQRREQRARERERQREQRRAERQRSQEKAKEERREQRQTEAQRQERREQRQREERREQRAEEQRREERRREAQRGERRQERQREERREQRQREERRQERAQEERREERRQEAQREQRREEMRREERRQERAQDERRQERRQEVQREERREQQNRNERRQERAQQERRQERRRDARIERQRELRRERAQDLRLANQRAERRAAVYRDRRRALREEYRHDRRLEQRRAARNARLNRYDAWRAQQRRAARRDYRDWRFYSGAAVLAGAGGTRFVISSGGRPFVVNRNDARFRWRARSLNEYQLGNGWRETVVVRPNGVRVVTVTDANGVPIRRYKILPGGRVVTLFNNLPRWWGDDTRVVVDARPRRVNLPPERYVVEPSRASPAVIYGAITADPVDEIERPYTLNQVLQNDGLRDFMPRIDVDTITFRTGSAVVDDNQISNLEVIGVAMEEAISENPNEVFLIEGHTDAVGSEIDNLNLSDARAEAVATLLTEYFEIPPENLVSQGFGEAYLKVETEGPRRANRRVAIRRITPLLETSDAVAGFDQDDAFEEGAVATRVR